MPATNPQNHQQAQKQLARLRAETVRLRVKQNALAGRLNGSIAIEGARSGNLGKQRKQGGQAPSLHTLRQEQELVARQLTDAQAEIERIEAWLNDHPTG
jgi:hypothetical protein